MNIIKMYIKRTPISYPCIPVVLEYFTVLDTFKRINFKRTNSVNMLHNF